MRDPRETAALERNLALIDVYYGAQNALFWLPVFVLWFSGALTAAQVLLLESVYYAAVVCLEVPSGWMSDRLGRRWTLMLSGLGWAGGAALIATGASFPVFAVGQVLLAAGMAFNSGTDSSLLYETLEALGRPEEMRARQGRAGSVGFAVLAVASLAGGLLGMVDLRLPYLMSVLGGLAAAAVAFAFVEPPRVGTHSTPREQLAVVAAAARNPVVMRVLVLVVWMTVLVHVPYELQQPWLAHLLGDGTTAAVSGLVVAVSFFGASLGSRLADPVAQWLDPRGTGHGFARGTALSLGLLGGVMGLMALGPYAWIAPVLVFRSVPSGLMDPLAQAEVHPQLSSSIRATWLSLQSLAGRLAFALFLVASAGVVGDGWEIDALRRVLVPGAGLAAVGAALALLWGRVR